MSSRFLILGIIFSVSLTIGQILFKYAANKISLNIKELGIYAFINLWLGIALVIYAFATLLWVWILMRTSLSKAYSFIILSIILVPLAASIFFSEILTVNYLIGLAVVMVGLFMINF